MSASAPDLRAVGAVVVTAPIVLNMPRGISPTSTHLCHDHLGENRVSVTMHVSKVDLSEKEKIFFL